MPLGRPPTPDPTGKYAAAFELYRLSQTGARGAATAADEIEGFLRWAIAARQPGFTVGEYIVVGALAKGVGRSRNNAALAVVRLVDAGMAIQDKPKSPYRIVADHPVFEAAGLVADEQISLTRKLDSRSIFSSVFTVETGDATDDFAVILADQLAASGDPLIRDAAAEWDRGSLSGYVRLRTMDEAQRAVACLAEVTFVRLSESQEPVFYSLLEKLRAAGVDRISMYAVLEQCGLRDLRAGRTQVTVAQPPAWLANTLAEVGADQNVDLSAYEAGAPMLKWTYALFRPETEPMVTFSVCYVRPDRLNVFIRSLDVESRIV